MIRIAVSACLLGREVRWDGRHKLDRRLCQALARELDLVPVCPEVELGLGVPRPPMQLVAGGAAGVRLRVVESGRDLTEEMRAYAARRIDALAGAGIAGFVLKSRSPSCGLRDVPVFERPGGEPVTGAAGRFAACLGAALPGLPVAEERELARPEGLEAFVARVASYHRERIDPGGE